VERSKDQIARHKEGVAEAIKQGSRAYRRVVAEKVRLYYGGTP
jgi:hypothetical protein